MVRMAQVAAKQSERLPRLVLLPKQKPTSRVGASVLDYYRIDSKRNRL